MTKLTIEIDLDGENTANGRVLKNMLAQLMRSVEQIPDWADARSILREMPNEPFAIMAEAMNIDHTRTEGRVVMHREPFNNTGFALEQISRLGSKHTIEEREL